MARDRVEVVDSKGCSQLLASVSPSTPFMHGSRPSDIISRVSVASSVPTAAHAPFAHIVICVTGLSKEARRQVMEVTERLGGRYSSSLHPQCTHLIVQSFGGRKFEHAMKHGLKNGLYVVTLGWFVDSVRKNVRLSESLYGVRNIKENDLPLQELNRLAGFPAPEISCVPPKSVEDKGLSILTHQADASSSSCKESKRSRGSVLSNEYVYVDSNIPVELKSKVISALTNEGARVLENWFVGCQANHVVCEGPHIQRYIGHANNIVTPMWILKTVKEKCLHRLVHLSSDLARQVAMLLENAQDTANPNDTESLIHFGKPNTSRKSNETLKNRQRITDLAKIGVRNRRHLCMQSCQTPLRPITPSSLLDCICWSISEPTSSAGVYTDFSETDVTCESHASVLFDRQSERGDSQHFNNFCRPLKESEKTEIIFKSHFLTILFPVDRFGELGPFSRTYFSEGGFTCVQVLDIIFNFYQENMSADEVAVAIHTDSRHSDRLRSVFASEESIDRGFVSFKRIDFLGSRRSFEILKRVAGENNNNVYELIIRA